MSERAYTRAGVDLEARRVFSSGLPGLLANARRPEVLQDAGPFSGLFRLGDRFRDPVLSASADSIGTKVKLHLAADRLDLCGPDMLGHSINDVMACGAEPLFFLDYIGGNGLTNEQKTALVAGVAEACAAGNVALLGGETADLPDLYPPGEFDLAGFIVGVVDRDRIIDGSRIVAGDILIGLPSTGPHTNGYSLIRRVFDIANGEPREETARRLEERPDILGGQTLGEALLTVHRPYYREVSPLMERIKGIAHITGGGYIENMPRILPPGTAAFIDTGAWTPLPIFQLIRERGGISDAEMYEVFNMGIGLVLVVGREEAAGVREAIDGAIVIGEIRHDHGHRVELRSH
jgi:phosphoribosylformylglycinamidine cyclo-ligase